MLNLGFILLFCCQILFGQELDVCGDGECSWTDPSVSKILVCLSTAISCTINCNTGPSQCQGLTVYNASPSLIVNCDRTASCRDINVK